MHSVWLFNHVLMQSSWNICLHVGRTLLFSICTNCSKYIWHSEPPNPSSPLIKKESNDNKLITFGSSLTAATGPAPNWLYRNGLYRCQLCYGLGTSRFLGRPCVHIQHKQKHRKMLKMSMSVATTIGVRILPLRKLGSFMPLTLYLILKNLHTYLCYKLDH